MSLSDELFIDLDVKLGRSPNVEEYNKRYNTKYSEKEYNDYVEEKWNWKKKKKYFYYPNNDINYTPKEKK